MVRSLARNPSYSTMSPRTPSSPAIRRASYAVSRPRAMTDHATAPRGRIVVFGILFWYPLAGVTFQFLHYLIGLRNLGYDVWYVEDSARYVYDPILNDVTT